MDFHYVIARELQGGTVSSSWIRFIFCYSGGRLSGERWKGGGQWATFSDPWSSRRKVTCRCWPWGLMTLAPRNRVDALFFVLILLMIDQCRMSGDMSCALCGSRGQPELEMSRSLAGEVEAWGIFICTLQSWVCTASLCLTLRREAAEQLPCQAMMGPTLSSHCLVIMAHRSNYSGRTKVASRADDGVGKRKLPSLWCVPTIHTSHSIFCVKLSRIWRTTYQKAGKLTVLTEVITVTDVIFFKGLHLSLQTAPCIDTVSLPPICCIKLSTADVKSVENFVPSFFIDGRDRTWNHFALMDSSSSISHVSMCKNTCLLLQAPGMWWGQFWGLPSCCRGFTFRILSARRRELWMRLSFT